MTTYRFKLNNIIYRIDTTNDDKQQRSGGLKPEESVLRLNKNTLDGYFKASIS